SGHSNLPTDRSHPSPRVSDRTRVSLRPGRAGRGREQERPDDLSERRAVMDADRHVRDLRDLLHPCVQLAANALHVVPTEWVHHSTLEALDGLRLPRVSGRSGEERGGVEGERGGTDDLVVTRRAGE